MISDPFLEQLATAFERGWLESFRLAATTTGLDIALLLAIASRESGIRNITGDHGRGFGIMQVDIGTDPQAEGNGLDPKWNIARGAEILLEKRRWIMDHAGKTATLSYHAARLEFLIPESITQVSDFERLWIAGYNAGAWPVYHYLQGKDPDYPTTGKNYSADVIARRDVFGRWLAEIHEFCK